MADRLRASVERLTGARVTDLVPLHGGDLSEVFCATLADGDPVVVKTGALVDTEARMLRAIVTAGAPAPKVVAAEPGLIVMQKMPDHPASPGGWAALGQGLKTLHHSESSLYGWEQDYAFGAAPIPNAPRHSWAEFWIEQRLLAWPGDLPLEIALRLETLARHLPDLLPAAPPVALLHGDLWGGNVLFGADGSACLIDPACYYGDPEVDLAMLALFGAPAPDFTAGYGGLPEGWEHRRPAYQLWPALVHLRLFGPSYRGMVESLLAELGA